MAKQNPAVLAERRACLRIIKRYMVNEAKWRDAYEKKGPVEMYHNAQGGFNACYEVIQEILDRGRRKRAK